MVNKKGQILWIALIAIVVVGGFLIFSGGDDSRSIEEDSKDVAAKQNTDNEQTIREDSSLSETFCNPGDTYSYASGENSVDAKITGLENYKGKEFCKAESKTTIESPAGEITTDTTYYFDKEAYEMYVVTKTSSSLMPEPQMNEVHLVDGKVV